MRAGSPLRAIVLLAGLLVTQAAADSYDIMGTVTVTADDAPLTLWVPFDREEQEPYATRMNAGVMTIYSIDAFSGTPGESLDAPRLSLSLTIAGGTVRAGDLTYFTGSDTADYGAGEGIGTLSFERVTVEGSTLSFGFEA